MIFVTEGQYEKLISNNNRDENGGFYDTFGLLFTKTNNQDGPNAISYLFRFFFES